MRQHNNPSRVGRIHVSLQEAASGSRVELFLDRTPVPGDTSQWMAFFEEGKTVYYSWMLNRSYVFEKSLLEKSYGRPRKETFTDAFDPLGYPYQKFDAEWKLPDGALLSVTEEKRIINDWLVPSVHMSLSKPN